MRILTFAFLQLVSELNNILVKTKKVPVYYGNKWAKDYFLYSTKETWTDARSDCSTMGGTLNTDLWNKPNQYIRTKAIENHWVSSNNLWVGLIKGPNSDIWYEDKYVEKCQIATDDTIFSGQSYSNLQCAAFNISITSSTDKSEVIYATSCNEHLGFICRINYGNIPDIGVEYYNRSEISRASIQIMNQITETANSETSCATLAFTYSYWCFAATFDFAKEKCLIECSKYPLLQKDITLVSPSNKTVLVRIHNKGRNLGWSIEITKPAYMGIYWVKDYVVFSERKTWLEAKDVCTSMGNSLQSNKWNILNWYIKTKAFRRGWLLTEDVWLGMIKHQNSDTWFEVSGKNSCLEEKGELSKQNHLERQCAVLNMSADSHFDKLLIYASSCDGQNLGFICDVTYGSLPKDVEFYLMSRVQEEGVIRKQWNVSSEIDCAIKSFSIIYCYAATYFPEDGHCLAECSEMPIIPDTVSLVNSSYNSTVLLRTHNKVFINHTESALPLSTDQYPCIIETSTDATTSSSQVLNNTSTTMFMPTDETTEAQNDCACVCPTNSINITEDILNQKITDIKKKLTVNKTSLSSTIRKKTSASDDRQTSVALGTLGICVITVVILTLVLCDFGYVSAWTRSIYSWFAA